MSTNKKGGEYKRHRSGGESKDSYGRGESNSGGKNFKDKYDRRRYSRQGGGKYTRHTRDTKYGRRNKDQNTKPKTEEEPVWVPKPSPPGSWAAIAATPPKPPVEKEEEEEEEEEESPVDDQVENY